MRGPSVRKKYDVRRLWRCPQCKQERLVAQTETTVRCSCTSSGTQMQLVEPQRYVRATPPPLDLVMTEADCDPDPGTEAASLSPEATFAAAATAFEVLQESIDFSDAPPAQNDHTQTHSPAVDSPDSIDVSFGE